jgi:hypothetical protein
MGLVDIALMLLMFISGIMFIYRYYSLMRFAKELSTQIAFVTSIGMLYMFNRKFFSDEGQNIRTSAIFWFILCNLSIFSLIFFNIAW